MYDKTSVVHLLKFFCLQGCASNPNDAMQQHRLRQAAEDLRSATNIAASNALKKKVIKRLEVSTK